LLSPGLFHEKPLESTTATAYVISVGLFGFGFSGVLSGSLVKRLNDADFKAPIVISDITISLRKAMLEKLTVPSGTSAFRSYFSPRARVTFLESKPERPSGLTVSARSSLSAFILPLIRMEKPSSSVTFS